MHKRIRIKINSRKQVVAIKIQLGNHTSKVSNFWPFLLRAVITLTSTSLYEHKAGNTIYTHKWRVLLDPLVQPTPCPMVPLQKGKKKNIKPSCTLI